jgi:2-polyprenyl-3-methyl-5-hydroxy-6-metoxy-1,4-benzoquinol methylase
MRPAASSEPRPADSTAGAPPASDPARPAGPACRLCGGTGRLRYTDCRDLEYFVEGTAPFYRCTGCGLVFMHPLPTLAELAALYPAGYNNFQEETNRLRSFLLACYHAHQATRCLAHLPARGAVLEVGCGSGDLLLALRARGAQRVCGVDISASACAVARARGLDVFCGTLEDFASDERFDLVVMSHVIEHVIDPVRAITRVAELLRPGGTLYVETPNVAALDARLFGARWGLIHYPRHLHLFDRRTLRRLLERGGFAASAMRSEVNSCGWALSIQGALRGVGIDRSRAPRSRYYPFLLAACLPLNALDWGLGGTAFLSCVARRSAP